MNIDHSHILEQISVVIQGKTFGLPGEPYQKQLTLHCIESIRRNIPGAEIILSTWEGTPVAHLPVDKVVFSQDPGAIAYHIYDPNFFNNNNRQIVSTIAGLKAASKKYAIKMRGDCTIIGTAFLDLMQESPRSSKYHFFKQRVLIPTHFSRNPRRIPQLIHPSDIFQIGLLEDLINLWDIPLQPEPETTRALPLEKRIINNSLESSYYRMKFGSEQYVWYAFCKKMGLDLELKHFGDLPAAKIMASDWSIVNNFVIAQPEKLGLLMPQRFIAYPFNDLYTHKEWKKLSLKYAQGVSRLFEVALITRVYTTNVILIVKRIIEKLLKHGPSKFFTVQKDPLLKTKELTNL